MLLYRKYLPMLALKLKAILYLNKCFCGLKFCTEIAAHRVQSCLKRIKLEYCATEVSIKYALPSYLFHHIAVHLLNIVSLLD